MSTKSKNKFLQWLSDAAVKWPMNTDPVVMQASGYKPTKTGVEYKPSEGAEQLRNNIAVISAVPNLVVNAGMTGIIPAIASEIGAATGGYAGTYAGQKLDEKFGTTYWTPIGGLAGTLIGGGLGYKAGNKYGKYAIKHDMLPEGAANRRIVTDNMAKEAALEMVDEQLAKATLSKGLPHNIGWAPAQKAYWWHHSNEPITKFKVPFKERWDVINHDADPNLIWLTKENGTAGMMSERPYHQQFKVALKKPMVQVGEVQTIPGQKNTSRNAIVKTARDMGADAVIFDGIADNKLRGQKVVAVMGDKTTPTHIEYPPKTTK